MNTTDWTDLERLWQSDVPAAAPALEVIARQQRRAWAWRLTWISEIVITIVSVAVSVWAMTSSAPYGLVAGSAALAFVLFAAGASLWARSLRRPPAAEASVLASLDAALHRARVSVRWGLASFWVMVPHQLFVAMLAFVWAGHEPPPEALPRMFIVLGVLAIWGGICQGVAIVYYQWRIRELDQLEELKRALDDDAS